MSETEYVPFIVPPTPVGFHVETTGEATPSAPVDPSLQPDWLPGTAVKHLSPSSLRMLKICPEQWRNRYILGKKERPKDHLTLGTSVHAAVFHSHEQKIESHQDLPVSEVVEFFHDKAWPDALEKDGGEDEIFWEKKPAEVRHDGERMTQAYHHTVSPKIQPIAIEQKMMITVEGIPVPIIGYLDVEEETHITDLKTGKQVTRKPDSNWRFQGAIYSLAKQKPTHFHSLSRAKTPSIATPLTDPEMVIPWREDLGQMTVKVLQDYVGQIEYFMNRYGPDDPWPTSGVYMDLKGGGACNYCGFRKTCPAWAWERAPILEVHP